MKYQGETSEQCVANAFFFHVLPKFTLFRQTRLFKDQLEFHYAVFYSYFVAFLSDTIRDSKQFKAFETLTQFLLWSIFCKLMSFVSSQHWRIVPRSNFLTGSALNNLQTSEWMFKNDCTKLLLFLFNLLSNWIRKNVNVLLTTVFHLRQERDRGIESPIVHFSQICLRSERKRRRK